MSQVKHDIDDLKKRSHYLEVINDFATRLLQSKTEDDVVWAVAKNAVGQLGFIDCVVYLFDDANEYLVQRAAHGPKNPIDFDINNPIRLTRGQGICGHVAETGKPELISDTSADPRYQIDDDMRLSEIAVPIISEGEVIGIIDSEHPDRNFYSDEDLRILMTIAAMASAKIVEARIQARLRNHQEELEKMVEIRTNELQDAVDQLQEYNGLLKQSNDQNENLLREITASISYAQTIQNAILPSHKLVKEYFNESFIIYLPKDIVAGDFYWMEVPTISENEGVFFAVADCTGHGVPGAIMSVLCNNALNRSIREFGFRDPGQILNCTRDIVNREFSKNDSILNDGMDIALCKINGQELSFAGAHNPLWIIRDGDLIELKADKQPIGRFVQEQPFNTTTFQLQKDDMIYLFSDGYCDQFGGPAGKKFKPSSLRELLKRIYQRTADEQRQLLIDEFSNWKGDLEQVDDVCVVGFKVK